METTNETVTRVSVGDREIILVGTAVTMTLIVIAKLVIEFRKENADKAGIADRKQVMDKK